ncbi:hypothetical protein Bca101_028853 [Brassica carinata]
MHDANSRGVSKQSHRAVSTIDVDVAEHKGQTIGALIVKVIFVRTCKLLEGSTTLTAWVMGTFALACYDRVVQYLKVKWTLNFLGLKQQTQTKFVWARDGSAALPGLKIRFRFVSFLDKIIISTSSNKLQLIHSTFDHIAFKLAEMDEKNKKSSSTSNKPKRPLTAFFIFMSDFRKTFKEENPSSNVKDVAKQGGEKWKSLTEEEKKVYLVKAAELKDRKNEDVNKESEGEEEEEEVPAPVHGCCCRLVFIGVRSCSSRKDSRLLATGATTGVVKLTAFWFSIAASGEDGVS